MAINFVLRDFFYICFAGSLKTLKFWFCELHKLNLKLFFYLLMDEAVQFVNQLCFKLEKKLTLMITKFKIQQ